MTQYRTGHMDVLAPTNLSDRERHTYIERQVIAELAKTGEHPNRIDYQSGFAVNGMPGVMRWGVTYTTGPYGQRTY